MPLKHWIEYTPDWRQAPMAYWVHVEQDGKPWFRSKSFAPPAPVEIPHKGYSQLCIEVEEFVLRFSSLAQLAEFIRVFSLTPIPTTRRLMEQRCTGGGLNSHWLSHVPTKLKSPRRRRQVVKALAQVLAERSVSGLV